MVSKNGEAQQCANTNWASMSVTTYKETNMSIVTTSELNFHGVTLNPVDNVTGIWLTSADVAKALGYKSTKSISNLFAQYEEEFSQEMTMVIESVTNGINGSTRRMKVRVFSLRGAHLVAMFARTPVAKEFRRWVLDILDKEVGNIIVVHSLSEPTEEERNAYKINAMARHFRICREMLITQIEPALRAIESPLVPRLRGHLDDGYAFLMSLEKSLNGTLLKGQKPRIH